MHISPKIGMPTPSKPRTPNLEDIRFLIKSEKIEKLEMLQFEWQSSLQFQTQKCVFVDVIRKCATKVHER